MGLFTRVLPSTAAFPRFAAGQLLHHPFRGLHSVHFRYGLQTRQVAKATLYTRGFSSFVASTTAPIATGWSEQFPGGTFTRCGPAPFHGAREGWVNAIPRAEQQALPDRHSLLHSQATVAQQPHPPRPAARPPHDPGRRSKKTVTSCLDSGCSVLHRRSRQQSTRPLSSNRAAISQRLSDRHHGSSSG